VQNKFIEIEWIAVVEFEFICCRYRLQQSYLDEKVPKE
jgi:hypothetical protein